MTDKDFAHAVRSVEMPRRAFLRNSLMAMPVVFVGAGVPLTAAAAYITRRPGSVAARCSTFATTVRSATVSHDDTAAIQKAINSLPSTGGTVFVPAGTYLINARQVHQAAQPHAPEAGSGCQAGCEGKPKTSPPIQRVLADVVSDVEISGGQIVGERDKHLGTDGRRRSLHPHQAVRSGSPFAISASPRAGATALRSVPVANYKARVHLFQGCRCRQRRVHQQSPQRPFDRQRDRHEGVRLGVQRHQRHGAPVRHRRGAGQATSTATATTTRCGSRTA